jgi:predicted dehydrogenase
MGGWHARYAARAGATIAAVVDPRTEAAGALAQRYGARAFADLDECLRECPTEAVHVCAPRDVQAALAGTALTAGRHVLVEKPAAPSAAEARRLTDLAERSGLLLCPVHQFPFQRGVARLRLRLAELGDLVRVTHLLASAGGEGLPEAGRRALLQELLPHPLSLFRALLGPDPEGGAGWSVLQRTRDDLEIAATRNGTRLTAVLSLRARPTRNELVVLGTKASARADLFHGFATVERAGVTRTAKVLAPFRRGALLLGAAGANLLRRAAQWEPAYPGLLALIRGFYASVREGAPAPVGRDELLEVAGAIERMGEKMY